MLKVTNDPAVVKQFTDQQFTVMALPPDAFAKLIRADTDKWGKVVKAADIKME
jgi:tripartite-type tricarboxylate transporter receptor subunit TctC